MESPRLADPESSLPVHPLVLMAWEPSGSRPAALVDQGRTCTTTLTGLAAPPHWA